jgi:sugar O-acyltransferase (sialic acid O-acetyltransferase NeuD family)
MKKNIVVFGTGKIAEVIACYAIEDCGYTIAAFVVDEGFKTCETFMGSKVVTVNEIKEAYPPAKYSAFVAVGYHDLNRLRAEKCALMKQMGYELVSVVSPKTNLHSTVVHGENCFIMPPCIIHPHVKLGNNVFVWSGAMIGHHSIIHDHAWFTSCCNISGNVEIGSHSFFAVNATLGHSIKIGERCFLGANTLVTKNLEDDKVVIAESDKPLKLTSEQFLKFSKFSTL